MLNGRYSSEEAPAESESEAKTQSATAPDFIVYDAEGNQVPYQISYDDKLLFPATVQANGNVTYTIAVGKPIEVDDELEDIAAKYFEQSGYGHRIRQHIGSALDVVPQLGEVYDMVFIDGDKREYPAYYNMLMDGGYVRRGSVMLADNILWYGKVAEPIAHNDKHTEAIVEFNRMVADDPRVDNVIVPIRDGINMIMVK